MTFTMGCVRFQPGPALEPFPMLRRLLFLLRTRPSTEGRGLLGNPSIYSCP